MECLVNRNLFLPSVYVWLSFPLYMCAGVSVADLTVQRPVTAVYSLHVSELCRLLWPLEQNSRDNCNQGFPFFQLLSHSPPGLLACQPPAVEGYYVITASMGRMSSVHANVISLQLWPSKVLVYYSSYTHLSSPMLSPPYRGGGVRVFLRPWELYRQ
jgi:hypothetical protein